MMKKIKIMIILFLLLILSLYLNYKFNIYKYFIDTLMNLFITK